MDFDPGSGTFNLTSAGRTDIFVQKLDSLGNFVWAKQMGGITYDRGTSIAIDSMGNVYTAGAFQDTVDFDPGPGTFNLTSYGHDDIFIQKLDASGNFVWVKKIGGSGYDAVQSIVLDVLGNVYYTGYFGDTVDFDPGPGIFNLISKAGDIYIQKLDASGNFIWVKQMGGISYDHGYSIALDLSGNVHITGFFHDTVDFDPGAGTLYLPSAGLKDIFVLKIDSSGNFAWAKQMGGISGDVGGSIAVDASGNTYTIGLFSDTVDFDPGPGTFNLTAEGHSYNYFQKLDASGNFIWAKQIGGEESSVNGSSISVDAMENIYIIGSFSGTIDFDPGPGTFNLNTPWCFDIFVLKLDSSGNFVWAKQMGGQDRDFGFSIVTDAYGNIYTTGIFEKNADFDPDTGTFNLVSHGVWDIFVQKLSQCKETTSSISVATCNSYTSPSVNYVWSTSGTYLDTIPNTIGCDSIITINLTITTVDATVSQTGNTLTANADSAMHQWLDCNDGYSIISGETNQSFTATINGSYAVEVTQNGCVDTSSFYPVMVVGIITNSFPNKINAYPNPTEGDFTIDLGSKYDRVSVTVTDINGKEINNKVFRQQQLLNLTFDKTKGIYIVKIESKDKQAVIKLIKN